MEEYTMKFIKKTFTILLVVACLVILTSCDLTSIFDNAEEIIEDAEWPYSETGENEINLNFAAINGAVDKGIYEWDISVTKNSTSNYNMKYYVDNSGEEIKQKYVYEEDTTKLAMLVIGTTTYYIDINNETISTTSDEQFFSMGFYILYAMSYGIINLEDDNDAPVWTFRSKTNEVPITNYSGESENTIEYVYDSVEEETSTESTQMFVYFSEIITPSLAKIHYDKYDEEELSYSIDIFRILHTEDLVDSDFSIPTEEDGYTVITESEEE
jgi:uncharacterized lipoprotein YehR (DUF1307 family)